MTGGGEPAQSQEYDLRSLLRWRRAGHAAADHYLAASEPALANGLALTLARRSDRFTRWDGHIPATPERSPLAGHAVSATALQSWAECPFRYFLGHVLRVSELELPEAELQISPLEKGALIHRVLDRFLRELPPRTEPAQPWTVTERARMRQIGEQECESVERSGRSGHVLLWELERSRILRNLERFLDEDESLRQRFGTVTVASELAFGLDGEEATLRVERGDVATSDQTPSVATVAASVQDLEMRASAASRELGAAEHARGEFEARREQLVARMDEFGTPFEDVDDASSLLVEAIGETSAALESIQDLRARGEELGVGLARIGQASRAAELEEAAANLEGALESARRDGESRRQTYQIASEIIDALREAGSDLMVNELDRVAPLLQQIYSTADPRPSFRVARLVSRMRQGRGRIFPFVADPELKPDEDAEHLLEHPVAVLSSSQMNVLAVSMFFTLNLGLPKLPLRTAILDDPLQSLDDLNLLGFVDLLRRIRDRRQLLISTHDSRFAALLERKLRPVTEIQRTVVIELEGWGREGPTVQQRDVPLEKSPVRIVA